MRLELTRRTDYAIRALVALADSERDGPTSAARIALDAAVPRPFLTRVLQDLGRAGFVTASHGRSGGYRLARSPRQVAIYDVIEAVEGSQMRRCCVLEDRDCDPARGCAMHEFWAAASCAFSDELSNVTLASISNGENQR